MKNCNFLTLLVVIFVLTFLNAGCKKNNSKDAVTQEPIHTVGETYQGGVIVYLLKSGDAGYDANKQHGLIAAHSDQNGGSVIAWGATGAVGVTGNAIGLGQANTIKIVAFYSASSYAAHICNNLTLNGFDDWYLPSKEELIKLYQVKNSINISNDRYWSSTEADAATAVIIRFMDGVAINQTKTITNKVRAVRSF